MTDHVRRRRHGLRRWNLTIDDPAAVARLIIGGEWMHEAHNAINST